MNCRDDGRCQQAIDYGTEGIGVCPVGKCVQTHTWYECGSGCSGCPFCGGGLKSCTVCGGGEGSLTTDCPGHRVSALTDARVYGGKLDYVAGQWVTK